MTNNNNIALKKQLMQLTQARQYSEAAALAAELVAADNKDIEAWYVLAQLQTQLGDIESAVRSYYQVCQGPSPVYLQAVEAAVNLSIQHKLWHLGAAPARELARLRPGSAEAQYNYGLCWYMSHHYLTAEPLLEASHKLAPKNEDCLLKLGMVKTYTGKCSDALTLFAKCKQINPDSKAANYLELWVSNYCDGLSDQKIYELHRAYGQRLESKYPDIELPVLNKSPEQKLRIGFCSADLYQHSVASFFLPIIQHARQANWEVFCYADVLKPDQTTERIKSLSDHWRNCVGLSDEEFVQQIRSDKLDVVVDLLGIIGDGRLEAYAMRTAPIQVTYLGYPNTTGLARMDYRLSDEVTDQSGKAEAIHTETLSRLPNGFLCYQPNSDAPEVCVSPCIASGVVSFGSFNVYQKISERCLSLWGKILQALPDSRLVIKSKPLHEDKLQEQVWQAFEAFDVARSRVEVLGWTESRESHLAIYNSVDIHLDTFPYNGTTTTCEAFWQGVPTVTLVGDNHRSRVGLSLMTQMGLEDWAAKTDQEYIELAIHKASDKQSLDLLRQSMRERMRASPLMDGPGFVKALDANFRAMIAAHTGD